MIILCHLKLENFYYIGAMNWLRIICDYSFFWSCKNELLLVKRQELLQKAKDRYHNCGDKEKAAEYYFENSKVLKQRAKKISIKTYQKKKKKQRKEKKT